MQIKLTVGHAPPKTKFKARFCGELTGRFGGE